MSKSSEGEGQELTTSLFQGEDRIHREYIKSFKIEESLRLSCEIPVFQKRLKMIEARSHVHCF
jgi:hypothetical protein